MNIRGSLGSCLLTERERERAREAGREGKRQNERRRETERDKGKQRAAERTGTVRGGEGLENLRTISKPLEESREFQTREQKGPLERDQKI